MQTPTEQDKATEYESSEWQITVEGNGSSGNRGDSYDASKLLDVNANQDTNQNYSIQNGDSVSDGCTDPNSGYWYPDPSTVDEGVPFTQHWIFNSNGGGSGGSGGSGEAGGTIINGLTRSNFGTKGSIWQPDPATKPFGVDFTQTGYSANNATTNPLQTRVVQGTAVASWSDWSPEASTIPDSKQFTQVRSDLNGVWPVEQRQATGTLPLADGWQPDPATKCAGTKFTQSRYFDGVLTNPVQTRIVDGLSVPLWSAWSPSSDLICSSAKLTQSRTDLNGACTAQTREINGTKDCGGYWYPDTNTVDEGVPFTQDFYVYPDNTGGSGGSGGGTITGRSRAAVGTNGVAKFWEPLPSTVCKGESFQQVGKLADGSYTVPAQYRNAVGTAQANWSPWAPDPTTVCAGVVFFQKSDDLYGRCTTRARQMLGVKICNGWSPDPATICQGKKFTQHYYFDGGQQIVSGRYTTREAEGTMAPNWSSWSPDPSTMCAGTYFTQQRTDLNGGCGTQQQTAMGTATGSGCYFEDP